jgi:hypothetical protein
MSDSVATGRKAEQVGAGKVLLLFLLGTLAFLCQAFVLMQLWNWFAVPLGVKNLTFRNSAGLLVFANCLRFNGENRKPQTYESLWAWAKRDIQSAMVALIIGWFLHFLA